MKKRVLLIGDTLSGGYNIAAPLMQEYKLRVFISKSTTVYSDQGIEYFYGDVNNYTDVKFAIDGCEIVIISNKPCKNGTPIAGLENIKRAIKLSSGIKRVIFVDNSNKKNDYTPHAIEELIAQNMWG